MSVRRCLLLCAPLALLLLLSIPAGAELTSEHKKELTTLTSGLNKINGMVSKKQFDEAEALLKETEERVAKIAEEASLQKDDKAFARVSASIEKFKGNVDKAKNRGKKPEGVSFTADVAPIITKNCVGCHGVARASATLNLETFAGWKKGGKNGQIVAPGNPNLSMIIRAVSVPIMQGGMPKDGSPLPKEDIQKLALWISQGANFDGEADDVPLGKLRTAAKAREIDSKIVINKPKGTETVSFTKDIAPWFTNLCLNCHSGNTPRGGLSLVTFEDMMRGGDSGSVIIPGDKQNSRLYRLVGGLENPRMPQGQARITRQNYNDLTKWFEEGNVYDGGDPRKPIRDLVPSDAEVAATKAKSMSDAEYESMRRALAEEVFRKALPNDTRVAVDGKEVMVIGTVPEARLKQVETWASTQLGDLRKAFGPPGIRGKLAVYVVKDKFGYDEVVLAATKREASKESHGMSVVTDNQMEAYVILQDVGDEASVDSPGLKVNVIAQVTEAFLKRTNPAMPNWLTKGMGLTAGSSADSKNPWFKTLRAEASLLAPSLDPDDLFKDSSYSPGTVGAMGYTLVEYLISNGGPGKFVPFVKALEGGQSPAAALKAVYNVDPPVIARGYSASLRGAASK